MDKKRALAMSFCLLIASCATGKTESTSQQSHSFEPASSTVVGTSESEEQSWSAQSHPAIDVESEEREIENCRRVFEDLEQNIIEDLKPFERHYSTGLADYDPKYEHDVEVSKLIVNEWTLYMYYANIRCFLEDWQLSEWNVRDFSATYRGDVDRMGYFVMGIDLTGEKTHNALKIPDKYNGADIIGFGSRINPRWLTKNHEDLLGLEYIYVPDSVSFFVPGTFYYTYAKYIRLPNGLRYASSNLFACTDEFLDKTVDTIFDCDDRFEIIGTYAYYFSSIKTFAAKECLRAIRSKAFYEADVLIADFSKSSIDYIPEIAFRFASKLYELVLPSTVKRIESNAFEGCDDLLELMFGGTKDQWNDVEIAEDAFAESSVKRIVCSDGIVRL